MAKQPPACASSAQDSSNSALVEPTQPPTQKVGFVALSALVVSAMIGGGIFNMTRDLAQNAGILAESIAWLITGVGMWVIATTFRVLAVQKPQLTDGIYTYAREGFGQVAAFFMAYGYWIYNTFSAVAYGTMIMSTLNVFFPGAFGEGNNWLSVALASAISWALFWVCSRGFKENAALNIVGTVAKLVPIFMFLLVVLIAFQGSVFVEHLMREVGDGGVLVIDWGVIFEHVGQSMLVTLWAFLGIEGAVVVSGDAKSQRDVSRATICGYVLTLALYVMVSILPFGIFTQDQLALAEQPAMGALMSELVGPWGGVVVNIGVIVSVGFAWLVWVLVLTQMPLYAAKDHTFPARFARQNKVGAPVFALLMTTLICQVLLLLTPFLSGEPWRQLISITGVMSMPCYLFCTAYLWKCAASRDGWKRVRYSRRFAYAIGVIGTLFACYLVYSGGLQNLMLSCAVYALGIPLLVVARREKRVQAGASLGRAPLFSNKERCVLAVIIAVGIAGAVFSATSGFFTLLH